MGREVSITWNGETHTQKEWAEITGIPHYLINARRQLGLEPEFIFSKKNLYKVKTRNEWTFSAVQCYECGCRCSNCFVMPNDLKPQCRMKQAVISLVRKYGKPKKENFREGLIKC